MTAPTPLVALLDQLDELRAKATPGPWHVGYEFCDCGGGYPCGHPAYPYELVGPKRTDPSPNFSEYDQLISEISQLGDADAALIVAAVNALPQLTAAVRAVLELADQWAALEHWDYKGPEKLARARADSANDAARILREQLTAALSVTP